MSKVKIYHNPECATSRNTLALIRNAGIEPEIIEYLQHPPTQTELRQMIGAAGLSVRAALRQNVDLYNTLKLAETDLSDEQLLALMLQHPILINRPFVISELGTRLARPSEVVLEILPQAQQGAFYKEDGQAVVDCDGQVII